MAHIEISSFFTSGGAPAVDIDNNNPIGGLNYPLVRIWEIDGSVHTLIVGDGSGTGQSFDGTMVPLVSAGTEDGFYSFVFTDTIGYISTKKYLVRSDAGPSISTAERYQTATIASDSIVIDVDAIADAVWDEPSTDHLSVGSTGLVLGQIKATTDQLFIDVATIQDIVDITLKYQTNRTVIDPVNKTMTVYDNDCVTILRTFSLLDSNGTPSTDEVCERVPTIANDNRPTC